MKLLLTAILASCIIAFAANLILTHTLQTTAEQAFSAYSAKP